MTDINDVVKDSLTQNYAVWSTDRYEVFKHRLWLKYSRYGAEQSFMSVWHVDR